MMKKLSMFICTVFAAFPLFSADIVLPAPEKTGGKDLMRALAERKTVRTYNPKAKLSMRQISNLCWAACGFNRNAKLTIPTARNIQDLILYVALPEGVYRYDAKANTLKEILSGDRRAEFGVQKKMFANAGAVLVYVSDFSKYKNWKESDRVFYSASHAGSAYQDVYLVCASENLGTVVCGLVPRAEVAKLLKLSTDFRVLYAQPVGVPAAD